MLDQQAVRIGAARRFALVFREQREGGDFIVLHLEPDGALKIGEALEAQPLDEACDSWRADARLAGDVLDAAQDVFVRLCAQDFRLLRTYDPARAGLPTWLAVVSRSCAIDLLRRRRQATEPIDDVPEAFLGVEDRHVEKLRIPEGLLTARQILILRYLYNEERDVVEIAQLLSVDAQTIRSTHHKALLRLRAHFREEDPAGGG